MALFLTEDDVSRLISVREILPAVEAALREQGEGRTSNRPRQRAGLGRVVLQTMNAAVPGIGRLGLKAYTTGPGGARFWGMLFAESGALLSLMQADRLGQVRTGCASGVAARYMARPDSRVVGLVGAGWQARTQVEAVCAALPGVDQVRVYSRTPAKVAEFCQEMAAQLPGVAFTPAASAEAAVRGADILITITNATEPVVFGSWISPGTTILAAGSNRAVARELDAAAIRKCRLIAADAVDQAKIEAGDLLPVVAEGSLRWEDLCELGDVVAGTVCGRQSAEEINMFKSLGLALEDVAAMDVIYRKARELGVGVELPIG